MNLSHCHSTCWGTLEATICIALGTLRQSPPGLPRFTHPPGDGTIPPGLFGQPLSQIALASCYPIAATLMSNAMPGRYRFHSAFILTSSFLGLD
jgi:hypothetical protein